MHVSKLASILFRRPKQKLVLGHFFNDDGRSSRRKYWKPDYLQPANIKATHNKQKSALKMAAIRNLAHYLSNMFIICMTLDSLFV